MWTEWLDRSIPVINSGSEFYITLSKVYIDPPDICRNRILSFHSPDTSEWNNHTERLDMSIPEAQWWSGDYIIWSKVYNKSSDIYRNRILSFHPPDTSERNMQILNDLMWAVRWLNGDLGIILHGQKCISSHETYAGIEYCLSIHRIHRKEIYKYWMTWCDHSSGSMVVWGLYYIVKSVYQVFRYMQE